MKHIIPLGDRLLVKREVVGEKLGSEGIIIAAVETKERATDIANVIHVPEHSFADKQLIERAEQIVEAQTKRAEKGDPDSLIALLQYNRYLKIKSIKPGDKVFISKYVGITFHDTTGQGELTMVNGEDIIGLVSE